MRNALIAATAVSLLAAPVHADLKDIGLTSAARNEVIVVTGTERKGLKIGDQVFQEQQIRTGADSAAQLLFRDETALTVGPNSSLVLDKAVYDPDKKVGELSVRAVSGAFRFVSGSSPSANYTIKTPAGTIGVRGTWFVLRIEGDIISILVRHGSVNFCNIAAACMRVTAGFQIRANRTQTTAPIRTSHETVDSVVKLWFGESGTDLASLAPGAGQDPNAPTGPSNSNPQFWWQTDRDFQPNRNVNQPNQASLPTTGPTGPNRPHCDSAACFQHKAALKFTHVLLGLHRLADRKDLSKSDKLFSFLVILPKAIKLEREIKKIDNRAEFKEFKRDLREFRRDSRQLIKCVDKKQNNFSCLH